MHDTHKCAEHIYECDPGSFMSAALADKHINARSTFMSAALNLPLQASAQNSKISKVRQ